MKRKAYLAVGITVLVAGVLLTFLALSAYHHRKIMPVIDRIEYYKLYVDLAEAVLVGFGAALLGILIPVVFTETRLEFERLRDSRTAYSEAKTGVEYLPICLCTLKLKKAAALVQRVHVRKHEADLFPELGMHLKRRGIDKTPDQWGDNLYAKLFTIRELLEAHAGEWDSLTPQERLKLVREAILRPKMAKLVKGAVGAEEIPGMFPKQDL